MNTREELQNNSDTSVAEAQAIGTPETQEWKVPDPVIASHDPLLACLISLTKYHHLACSPRKLVGGLPLENNQLTPALFIRAAYRAGLDAEINPITLENISLLVLPAVLLLKNKKACVLLKKQGKCHVLFPETGTGVTEIDIQTLEEDYTGFAIYTKPSFQFTERSEETLPKLPKSWFWGTIAKAWPLYMEVLLASGLINVFTLAFPLFAMNVYDRVVPNYAIQTMWVLVSGVVIVFVFDYILRALRSYFIDAASKKIDVQLSAVIFEQILGVSMNVRPSSVGAFANIIQSFESFRDFITSTTIAVLVDLPFVILFIFIIYLIGGNLAYVPLFIVPIVLLAGLFLQMPLTRLTQESFQYSAEKQATLIESIAAAEAIKSAGGESVMQQRWEKLAVLSAGLGNTLRFYANTGVHFSLLAQQIGTTAIIILGVYKISEGTLTVGALIAATILAGRALAPMSQIASLIMRYHQSIHALKSLNQIMQLPIDSPPGETYLHRPDLRGNIALKNVSFKYQNSDLFALQNVNLQIKEGERVAIIGRVGSGKSTLAKVINGLYHPASGSVLIDGTDYLQIDPADLRYNMGYVPQDIVLFYGSIKYNILFGAPQVDDAKVLRASKIAGVDLFASKHPHGYDVQVGERGRNLSRGQRQAVAIARALLMSPPIIILDEPSTSMDDSSEAVFRDALDQYLGKEKTLILITHKAAMLKLVDRVIVIDSGKVILDGPKNEVLSSLKEGHAHTEKQAHG